VFSVCPWRSIKYEEVYLRAYDSVSHARASLGHYLVDSESHRAHQLATQRSDLASLGFGWLSEQHVTMLRLSDKTP
jgi:hypothetical protein